MFTARYAFRVPKLICVMSLAQASAFFWLWCLPSAVIKNEKEKHQQAALMMQLIKSGDAYVLSYFAFHVRVDIDPFRHLLSSKWRQKKSVGREDQYRGPSWSPLACHFIATHPICLDKEWPAEIKTFLKKTSSFRLSASLVSFLWGGLTFGGRHHFQQRSWTRNGREWVRVSEDESGVMCRIGTRHSPCPEWFLLALLWWK